HDRVGISRVECAVLFETAWRSGRVAGQNRRGSVEGAIRCIVIDHLYAVAARPRKQLFVWNFDQGGEDFAIRALDTRIQGDDPMLASGLLIGNNRDVSG